MSAELKRKRSVRRGHRSYAKSIVEAVEGIVDSEFQSTNISQMKKHRITLTERLQTINTLDEEILNLVKETEIESQISEAGKFTEYLHETLVKIDDYLSLGQQNSTLNETQANTSVPNSKPLQAKLPKLEIKKFGGDPIQWLPFWDSFESSVDRHVGLDDIEKFNYLKSFLEKEALATVSGLPLTSENYKSAKKLLCDRFGNKQILISSHMEGMYKMNAVTSINDVKQIRHLYDQLESHIRALQTLEVEPQSYGSLLVPLLMDKLPNELRLVISRKMENEVWDLEGLLRNLKTELEARERCSQVGVHSSGDRRPPRVGIGRAISTGPSSASALTTQSKGGTISCTYCRSNHSSAQCSIVPDVTNRKAILRKQGRCFVCLRRGHLSRDCNQNKVCFKCTGSHHVSICERTNMNNTQQYRDTSNTPQSTNTPLQSHLDTSPPQESKSTNANETQRSTALYTSSETSVLLQTALAKVSSTNDPRNSTTARVLFDSGSQRSYISQKLKKKLNLTPLKSEQLIIKAFGQENEQSQLCDVVQVSIQNENDNRKLYITAFTVPLICAPLHNQVIDIAQRMYPHLADLPVADNVTSDSESDIDILIGSDYYWHFITGRIRKGIVGPVALETKLGWVLSGTVCHQGEQQTGVNLITTHVLKIEAETVPRNTLSDDLISLWGQEMKDKGTLDEDPIYSKFENEIQFTGERYKVKLPFIEEHLPLSDNYDLSQKRLTGLLRRLRSQPDILERYDGIIKDQLNEGIIESVKSDVTPTRVHYLPHHGVTRMDKDTTKLRIVYDGSSKTEGPSLNDCLHSGPALNPLLFDVLLRFRAHKVALAGDIQQAFLNVKVEESQRDFLRFLWVRNINDINSGLVTYRFCRVVFGLTCSPFLLNATIRHHVLNYETNNCRRNQELLNSLYVDDYLCSYPDVQEAFDAFSHVKKCLKIAGFNMRKWKTNSLCLQGLINDCETLNGQLGPCEVKGTVQKEDETYSKSEFQDCGRSEGVKILGTTWHTDRDKLTIDFNNVWKKVQDRDGLLTKRAVLRTSARIYDPLGLISPVVVLLRIIFQDLCKANTNWDDPVSEVVHHKFYKIMEDIQKVQRITVDRQYFRNIEFQDIESVQLHGFSDASLHAYGACVYLRVQSNSGNISCSLIASKTRVTPVSGATIPRLELMAAVCLAKLITNVRQALQVCMHIDATYCWTDSQIVLWWIIGEDKKFDQFVHNRVIEIRKKMPPSNWNYCSSENNPADIASRGAEASRLKNNEKWWHGPEYLKEVEDLWPKNRNLKADNLHYENEQCELNNENLKNHIFLSISLEKPILNLETIISLERFSSMTKLVRVTAYVLRFTRNVRSKSDRSSGTLSQQELHSAEIKWILSLQQKLISQDDYYKQLQCSLGLFKDEQGVLRCKGRLENAPLSYDTRFPILLPSKNGISNLIIQRSHIQVKHGGVKETLNQLRSKFWVIRGRQMIKKALSKCATCKRMQSSGYRLAKSAPLPEYRLNYEFAFTKIGIDFAGPIYVKNIYENKKKMHKCYIVLFTCASSRAIHLELAPDLQASTFLRSLKRFQSRRGVPSLIISDNGSTFRDEGVQNFASSQGTTWKFNLALAPWWGGFFERLVRSVILSLKKNLRNAKLTYEEMMTTLSEIEGVLNSRPLTYAEEEVDTPLTPSQLVIGRRILSSPEMTNTETQQAPITRRLKYLQQVLEHFQRRFKTEYLTELRKHHTSKKRRQQEEIIKNGDIVVIKEEKKPRQLWQLGRVQHIIRGRDGEIRGAGIRLPRGNVLRRPLQRLYPVEVQEHSSVTSSTNVRNASLDKQQLDISFVADDNVPNIVTGH